MILTEHYTVKQNDFVNAGKVSVEIKKILRDTGIPAAIIRRIAVACYEAEINLIIHSYGGTIDLFIDDDGTVSMYFNDCGPGIPDIEKAMQQGYSTASDEAKSLGFGAGMGLYNIKRVADTFKISSSPKGTHLFITFKAI